MGKYSTPRVPHETPMYEVSSEGKPILSRTWMIFFERLGRVEAAAEPTPGEAGPDLIWRTLLVKDSHIGNDIADHVTAQKTGTATRFAGVLRKAISSDLTVRVRKNGTIFCTLTIPGATGVGTVVETASFASAGAIAEDNVFSWDITASDEQMDLFGVASFTLFWETEPEP